MKQIIHIGLSLILILSMTELSAQAPTWTVNENAFSNNMSVVTKINTGCKALSNPNNMVAAFFGEECRGVAYTDQLENGTYVAYLTLYSNSDQQLTFKFYDSVGDRTYNATTTLMFKSDDIISDFSVNANNKLPTSILLSNSSVDENANNVTVGTFSTNDTDSGQEYAFSLVTGTGDTDNGSFTIVGGELKNTVSFNCEAKNSYSIRIKAVDAIDGCSTEKTVTIKVNDVNEASTDLDLSANSVMENVAANTIIGALSTSDPDTSTVFTYSLVTGAGSTDNSSFNISGKSLRITNSPDYEAKSSYSVRIKSSDIGGLTVENTYTINILDYANETAPVLGNLSNQTICPSKIGDAQTLSISDDNPSSLAFTMSSNNTALVPVSGISVTGTGTNRQVKVNPQSGQTGSAQITLIGKNSYQLTDTVKFTVNVMDQTPPDKPSLADINAICEVTSLDTATTTDGCAGTIKGTHNASLPYTNPGTYEITWTFSDKSGNSTTAIQKIVIRSIASQLDVVGNKITVSEENASYQWINCDNQEAIQGATQRTFTVTSSGNYAVIVSKNGCTDTSDCAAVVYNSIAEYTNSIQGQVFPNPTAHFTSFNAMESGTYRLINSLGQTVTTLEVKKGEVASMSVEGYPKGIYYLKGLGYNYTVIVDKP